MTVRMNRHLQDPVIAQQELQMFWTEVDALREARSPPLSRLPSFPSLSGNIPTKKYYSSFQWQSV